MAGISTLTSFVARSTRISATWLNGVDETVVGQPLDPVAYGAIANGTTSDSTAIQNCLNAAAAAGRAVDFKGRTYYVPTGILLRSGLRLIGNGARLLCDTGGDVDNQVHIFQNDTTQDDSENIQIDGFTFAHTGTFGLYTNGIWLTAPSSKSELWANNFRITNCRFEGVRVGIKFEKVATDDVKRVGDAYVSGITGKNVASALLVLDGKHITVGTCRLVNDSAKKASSFDCVHIHAGEDITIGEIYAENCNEYALGIRNVENCNTKNIQVGSVTGVNTGGVIITTDAAADSSESVSNIQIGRVLLTGGPFSLNGTVSTSPVKDVQVGEVIVHDAPNIAGQIIGSQRTHIERFTAISPTNQGFRIQNADAAYVGHLHVEKGGSGTAVTLDRARKGHIRSAYLKSAAVGFDLLGASGTMGGLNIQGAVFDSVTDPIHGDGTTSSSHRVRISVRDYGGATPTYTPATNSWVVEEGT